MTQIVGPAKHKDGPKTHVLIIGVGRYKHLLGGKGSPNFPRPPLGQLTSPPVSARAIADWFTGGSFHNNTVPLGSVELLLSDATSSQYQIPNAASKNIKPATMKNIEQAFNAWYERCNAHPDNIAVFYFCGHGLQMDSMVLLPEDFASNVNNPWTTAIDFHRTMRGMSQCAAHTQLYVIDACRQWTTSLLQDLDVQGQTLKKFTIGQGKPRIAPAIFATKNGSPAFGDGNQKSRLTAALIECLNGGAADRQGGKWLIDARHLGERLKKLVALQNESLKPEDRQIVDASVAEDSEETGDKSVLHELQGNLVPDVVVSIGCLPDDAVASAKFYVKPSKGKKKTAAKPGRWLLRLQAGVYEIGASFAGNKYMTQSLMEEPIGPPVYSLTLTAREVENANP